MLHSQLLGQIRWAETYALYGTHSTLRGGNIMSTTTCSSVSFLLFHLLNVNMRFMKCIVRHIPKLSCNPCTPESTLSTCLDHNHSCRDNPWTLLKQPYTDCKDVETTTMSGAHEYSKISDVLDELGHRAILIRYRNPIRPQPHCINHHIFRPHAPC